MSLPLLLILSLFFYHNQNTSVQYKIIETRTEGLASYYADKFHGRTTANGESFNNYDLTAAHKSIPFNTYVNVVNRDNGRNVIVRINDRGPYAKDRIIDLSKAAALHLDAFFKGIIPVKIIPKSNK